MPYCKVTSLGKSAFVPTKIIYVSGSNFIISIYCLIKLYDYVLETQYVKIIIKGILFIFIS